MCLTESSCRSKQVELTHDLRQHRNDFKTKAVRLENVCLKIVVEYEPLHTAEYATAFLFLIGCIKLKN